MLHLLPMHCLPKLLQSLRTSRQWSSWVTIGTARWVGIFQSWRRPRTLASWWKSISSAGGVTRIAIGRYLASGCSQLSIADGRQFGVGADWREQLRPVGGLIWWGRISLTTVVAGRGRAPAVAQILKEIGDGLETATLLFVTLILQQSGQDRYYTTHHYTRVGITPQCMIFPHMYQFKTKKTWKCYISSFRITSLFFWVSTCKSYNNRTREWREPKEFKLYRLIKIKSF